MTGRRREFRAIEPAAPSFARLLRDGSAGAIVYTALMIPLLVGALGLAADVGLWYAAKRGAQTIADAAAIAGARELARGGGGAAALAAAQEDAAANGYDPDAGDVLVVNAPPASGPNAGAATAVEALVRRTPPAPFSRLLFDQPVTVAARAVASVAAPDSCVWLLEPDDTALELVGTADAELGCGVYATSASSSAIELNGGACLTATSVTVVGGVSGDCIAPAPDTNAAPLGDPLAYLGAPGYAGCTYPNKVKVDGGESETLAAGVYCGGIDISGGADVTFEAGTHVIAGGTFKATGGSTLSGAGVTFYLTEDGGGGFAELQITAADVDLSAPASGNLRGVLFFEDRDAPETLSHLIAGNAELELEGVLYFPNSTLRFAGGSSAGNASTLIVARKLRLVGDAALDADGPLDGLPSGLTAAGLIE